MSYKAAKLVRKKHRVFKKYKDKDHPPCKRASRVASCEVKKVKYNFERKLAENIKTDTKSFYAYVKGRAKAGRSIGPLVNDQNVVVDLAEEMSQEFYKFFSSVFTKERTGEVPEANWVYKENDNGFNNIDITEEKVSAKLDKIRDDNAAGADDLLPRFLNSIKKEIISPIVMLFKKVLREEIVPSDWRDTNVVPIFKVGQRCVAANYRPVSLTSQICKVFEAVVRDEIEVFG